MSAASFKEYIVQFLIARDVTIKKLKQEIKDYEYCLDKMNGQIDSYWMKCDFCGHDVYEYDPKRSLAYCERCNDTRVCYDGCYEGEGMWRDHPNCFSDAGWKTDEKDKCEYCSNCWDYRSTDEN